MTSVLTDASTTAALQRLGAAQSALAVSQQQLSTGLRVSQASDNAAYWSIATAMTADRSSLSALADGLSVGISVVTVASTAVGAVLSTLGRIKADLVTAGQPGASLASVQSDIAAQQQALLATVTSASYGGINLLDGSQGAGAAFLVSMSNGPQFVTVNTHGLAGNFNPNVGPSFTNPSAGVQLLGTSGFLTHQFTDIGPGNTLSGPVAGKQVNQNGSILYNSSSVLSFDITTASSKELGIIQTGVETLIGEVTGAGAQLGTALSVMNNQQTYVSALNDAVTSGVGALVDADMSVASSKLRAQQCQVSLIANVIAVANEDSRRILDLFPFSTYRFSFRVWYDESNWSSQAISSSPVK